MYAPKFSLRKLLISVAIIAIILAGSDYKTTYYDEGYGLKHHTYSLFGVFYAKYMTTTRPPDQWLSVGIVNVVHVLIGKPPWIDQNIVRVSSGVLPFC